MKLDNFYKSLKFAFRGLKYVYKNEQNFKIQLFFGLLALILSLFLQLSKIEFILIIGLCFSVLILEVMNTILEKTVDIIKPRLYRQAGLVKDISAGMVLLVSIFSIIIGFIIFIPHIVEEINKR